MESDFTSQSCTICLNTLAFPVCKLLCAHFFCMTCIQSWCNSHNSCPLCSLEITQAFHINADFSQETIFFESKKPEKELSLDCLDHKYFKEEISKLLRVCYEIEVSRFKQRNAKGTAQEWKVLQSIKAKLEEQKQINENFFRFDPVELLKLVHELNSDLASVKNGEIPHGYEEEIEEYEDISDQDDYDDYYN